MGIKMRKVTKTKERPQKDNKTKTNLLRKIEESLRQPLFRIKSK